MSRLGNSSDSDLARQAQRTARRPTPDRNTPHTGPERATHRAQTRHTPGRNTPHTEPKRATRGAGVRRTAVGLGFLEVFGVLVVDLV
jgi:hypothetical protein